MHGGGGTPDEGSQAAGSGSNTWFGAASVITGSGTCGGSTGGGTDTEATRELTAEATDAAAEAAPENHESRVVCRIRSMRSNCDTRDCGGGWDAAG